jgi:hypothetical protein
MSNMNISWENFIAYMIAHGGDREIAYMLAYPDANRQSAYSSATRLLRNPYIATRIAGHLMEIEKDAVEKCRKLYEKRIADGIEKRELLARIMRGEEKAEKEILKDGEIVVLKSTSINEKLRAIALDERIERDWQSKRSKYLD